MLLSLKVDCGDWKCFYLDEEENIVKDFGFGEIYEVIILSGLCKYFLVIGGFKGV